MNKDTDNPPENIDELLDKLGTFGPFQFMTFFGLQLLCCWVTFSIMQISYAVTIPDWYCFVGIPTNAEVNILYSWKDEIEHSNNIDNLTRVHGAENRNQTFKACSVNGTKCEAFKFMGSSRTVVREWGLVCDKAWIKQLMLTVNNIGYLFGTLIAGQMADTFGRKNVLYIFLFVCSLINLATGFSVSWEMFTVCKFLEGICIAAVFVCTYPYSIEIIPQRWRSFQALFPTLPIGCILFAGIGFILDDWASLHFASSALMASFVIGFFCFPESPRWLAVHNKLQEAEKAVGTIARFNRKHVPRGTAAMLSTIALEEKNIRNSERMYSIVDLFSTLQIAKTTLIMSYLSCSIQIVMLGIAYGVSNLNGNVFLNIFIVSSLQIPVVLTSFYAVNRYGRLRSTMFYLLLSLVPSVGCLVVSLVEEEPSSIGTVSTALSLMIMIAGAAANNVVILWCLELYPTAIRNLGYSFVSAFCGIGGILVPFLVNFDEMVITSYAIIAWLLASSAILIIAIRETAGLPLAETATKAVKSYSSL